MSCPECSMFWVLNIRRRFEREDRRTVSMSAESDMFEEERFDLGSFCPSKYTSSRNTSHVSGYTYSIVSVNQTPNRKNQHPIRRKTHLPRRISRPRQPPFLFTIPPHRHPTYCTRVHTPGQFPNTQHPRVSPDVKRVALERDGDEGGRGWSL